ncbi:MAG: hypothetical protein QM760_17530 [Nibricoccus sp.]
MGGKYTININTEMNYGRPRSPNVSETAELLFSIIRDISVTGAHTARVMYEARGWFTHHNTDLGAPLHPSTSAGTCVWPTGGAWLSTHLWNTTFSPATKNSSLTFTRSSKARRSSSDTLVPEPKHGWLVTNPSHSPEHAGRFRRRPDDGPRIVRVVFNQAAKSSEILGTDAEFRTQVLAARAKLAPFQIGKFGQLQEWLDDRDKEKDAHRHPSHLYLLYPSALITPETPNSSPPRKKPLDGRGLQSTGWAWRGASTSGPARSTAKTRTKSSSSS